jgi:hypothetical protein
VSVVGEGFDWSYEIIRIAKAAFKEKGQRVAVA